MTRENTPDRYRNTLPGFGVSTQEGFRNGPGNLIPWAGIAVTLIPHTRLRWQVRRISLMQSCTGAYQFLCPGEAGIRRCVRLAEYRRGGCGSKGPDVSDPGWLNGVFAALMMLIALCCAGRLAVGWLRDRDTERDADGLHVLMGVAMAGMFEPQLSPVPATVWRIVFVAGAAWFSWLAIRIRGRRQAGASRCAHPVPHAVESAAMVYMLLPTGAQAPGLGPGMTMPGPSGPGGTGAGNPVLALVLALFMLGYTLWTTDRLASLSRSRAARPRGADPNSQPAAAPLPDAVMQRPPGPGTASDGDPSGRPSLAPRLAAGYKIAMSLGMGYMLITML